jgi:hypothetical protein
MVHLHSGIISGTDKSFLSAPKSPGQVKSGAFAASYIGIPGFFPEDNVDGHECYHSPPPTTKVKKDRNCKLCSPCILFIDRATLPLIDHKYVSYPKTLSKPLSNMFQFTKLKQCRTLRLYSEICPNSELAVMTTTHTNGSQNFIIIKLRLLTD